MGYLPALSLNVYRVCAAGPHSGRQFCGEDYPFLAYSGHQVALGRAELRQALRQFHLHWSQRKVFIPNARLILRPMRWRRGGVVSFTLNSLTAILS
jgi:hypothetical protein